MAKLIPKPCKICGKVFKPKVHCQLTCSAACAKQNRLERSRHYQGVPRAGKYYPCKVCGIEFVPSHTFLKTCSRACSDENIRNNRAAARERETSTVEGLQRKNERSGRHYRRLRQTPEGIELLRKKGRESARRQSAKKSAALKAFNEFLATTEQESQQCHPLLTLFQIPAASAEQPSHPGEQPAPELSSNILSRSTERTTEKSCSFSSVSSYGSVMTYSMSSSNGGSRTISTPSSQPKS